MNAIRREQFIESARAIKASEPLIELALTPPKGEEGYEKETAAAKRLFPNMKPASVLAAAKQLKANVADFEIYGTLPVHRVHGTGTSPEDKAFNRDFKEFKKKLRAQYNYNEKGGIPEGTRAESLLKGKFNAEVAAFADNWVYTPETDENLEDETAPASTE